MTPHANVCIQKGTQIDRQYLLDRTRDPALGVNTHVVYIYSLEADLVAYPIKNGRVVYIGEAGRTSEATGKRFSQHISTSSDQGGDTGTIYALSRYYWQNKIIRLQIYVVNCREDRKRIEGELLRAHVKEYGALPICQGTTGGNYKTSVLANITVPGEFLAIFEPASNNALDTDAPTSAAPVS